MKHTMTSLALLATLLAGAACSLIPDARVPDTAIPVRYKESGPDTPLAAGEPAGVWRVADPADHRPRGAWWAAFDDPTLDALEAQAVDANQDVQAAARLRQSRAVMEGTRAAFLPEVTAGFGPTRQLPSGASQGRPDGEAGSAQTLWRTQANAAWEVDLFGRVSATAVWWPRPAWSGRRRCWGPYSSPCRRTWRAPISCSASWTANWRCTATR